MSSPSPPNTSSYGITPLESWPYKGSVWILVPFFGIYLIDMGTVLFWSECKVSISSWGVGKDLTLHFFQVNWNNITSANGPQELHFSFHCLHLFPITTSKIYRKRPPFARTYYFAFLIFVSHIACIFHKSSWILSPLKRTRERKTGLHLVEGHKEHKAEVLGGRSVNWQEGKDSK